MASRVDLVSMSLLLLALPPLLLLLLLPPPFYVFYMFGLFPEDPLSKGESPVLPLLPLHVCVRAAFKHFLFSKKTHTAVVEIIALHN